MQDKKTARYWSIVTEEAVYGEAKGKKLELLPGATKTTWGICKIKHPNSLVLSYGGREHDHADSYLSYFRSNRGFRGMQTKDDRLANKEMIYSFHTTERLKRFLTRVLSTVVWCASRTEHSFYIVGNKIRSIRLPPYSTSHRSEIQ